MFHETSARVVNWANSVLGDEVTDLGSPSGAPEEEPTVRVTLLDARPSATRPGLRVDVLLRYLVTVSGPDEADVHRRLGQLTFAAVTNSDLQIDREPLSIEFWKALGLVPRPALVISMVASRERQRIEGAQPVRLLPSVALPIVHTPRVERREAEGHLGTSGHNRRATDRRPNSIEVAAV